MRTWSPTLLSNWPLDGLQLLFIENVGNLVCPASYDLGEDKRVVLLSVTEGEDKPLKYPVIFRNADLVLVTKSISPRPPASTATSRLAPASARPPPRRRSSNSPPRPAPDSTPGTRGCGT